MSSRGFGIFFGIGVHVLFAWTICRLFPFLLKTVPGLASQWVADIIPLPWYLVDALLAVQFGVSHSFLLLPAIRKRLSRWIHGPFYGCFFCLVSCLSLLLLIECWQPDSEALFQLDGLYRRLVQGLFLFSWIALFYSLNLTGMGYQTGWTSWWAWLHRRPAPQRRFEPRGAYKILRHPIYFSFLGLVWFTPDMTWDRVILVMVWTVYIFIGSYLKDRRLLYYIGNSYQQYQAKVPGYPFVLAGPLSTVPLSIASASPAETGGKTPHMLSRKMQDTASSAG